MVLWLLFIWSSGFVLLDQPNIKWLSFFPPSLQSQNKEYGRVYEKSVRRLETLEIDYRRSCDEIERISRDLNQTAREKSQLENDIAYLRRGDKAMSRQKMQAERDIAPQRVNRSDKTFSPDQIRAQAIVIERNGQLTSPFL